MTQRSLGARGEEVAAEYLRAQGYRILARNWRDRAGEIDLVAQQADTLVMVEVKLRAHGGWVSPEEAVTPAKQRRLIEASWAYLESQGSLDQDWRIDVIAIELSPAGEVLRLDHYTDAVRDPEEGQAPG